MRDWVSTLPRALLACACLTAMPAAAQAGDLHFQPGLFADPQFDPKVTVGTSVSHVNGIAHEFVYSNGGNYKVSELDWQIKDTLMLNAEVGIRFSPWMSVKIEGGTKLTGSSDLVDSDWIYHGPDVRDHWSHHEDTTVKSANRVDVSGNLSLYRHPNFTLDAIGGFRWNEWEFQANGGTYIYSTDKDHLNDQVGEFKAGEPAISYKQNLLTPYLGLGLNANFGRFGFDASFTGSPFSFAHDFDRHFARGLLFEEETHNQTYLDYKFGGTYQFSDSVTLKANWERETYSLVKGQTSISTIGPGLNGIGGVFLGSYGGPAGGLDNETQRYSVGLTYNLN